MLRIIIFISLVFFSSYSYCYEGVWLLIDTNKLNIEVKQGDKTLDIIEGIAIGRAGAGQKIHRGDDITPYGEYRIGWVGEKSAFHRFFGLTYPSPQDAENGLRKGIIDKYTYADIMNAHLNNQVPPQNTPLGGRVGIHGIGRGDEKIHKTMNWTHGCIALTNPQIDHLSKWVATGTIVRIK